VIAQFALGPRLGMERCGKINAVNSGSESWTGIGVVAGFGAVVLIRQWPHVRNGDTHWEIKFLHILQEVRTICKTRNQLLETTTMRTLKLHFPDEALPT
jgi:hypothetical protein